LNSNNILLIMQFQIITIMVEYPRHNSHLCLSFCYFALSEEGSTAITTIVGTQLGGFIF
jgi:hypothetical protein